MFMLSIESNHQHYPTLGLDEGVRMLHWTALQSTLRRREGRSVRACNYSLTNTTIFGIDAYETPNLLQMQGMRRSVHPYRGPLLRHPFPDHGTAPLPEVLLKKDPPRRNGVDLPVD